MVLGVLPMTSETNNGTMSVGSSFVTEMQHSVQPAGGPSAVMSNQERNLERGSDQKECRGGKRLFSYTWDLC